MKKYLMSELDRCPFCGGNAIEQKNYLGQLFVCCENCGATVFFSSDDYALREHSKLIERWNTRYLDIKNKATRN